MATRKLNGSDMCEEILGMVMDINDEKFAAIYAIIFDKKVSPPEDDSDEFTIEDKE